MMVVSPKLRVVMRPVWSTSAMLALAEDHVTEASSASGGCTDAIRLSCSPMDRLRDEWFRLTPVTARRTATEAEAV